ncbi:MAG: translation initiation factor IF-1A, partial [Crenarchaeota archaeon]|nr:translation initiation factor IF-1A [Thermoproteota archaeon]
MIAKVLELLGDDRVRVICPDGKIRIARIPGKYRRKLWLRVGDYVIIVPW